MADDLAIDGGDTRIIEARSDRAEHRHRLGGLCERQTVALDLFGDIAQRVATALTIELVDHDDIGEVEHVDLLELTGGAELRRHHVERKVDQRHDARVALADAGRLHDHQVEACRLGRDDDVGQRRRQLAAGLARRDRAHVDVRSVDRVHPDAVAEQRAAALPPGRIDGDHGDPGIAGIEAEAADDLVGQRRLAGAAGAGDADHRNDAAPVRQRVQLVAAMLVEQAVFQGADDPGQMPAVAGCEAGELARQFRGDVEVGAADHVVDHPLQPHAPPVLRRVDAAHAVLLQLRDLLADDYAAAAAEHADLRRAALAQSIEQVLEIFDVPALIGADGDAVGVLLQRRLQYVVDGAVVAEMDDLDARRLQHPANDVDRGVVPVKQRRRGDETDRMAGAIGGRQDGALFASGGEIVGHVGAPAFRQDKRASITLHVLDGRRHIADADTCYARSAHGQPTRAFQRRGGT